MVYLALLRGINVGGNNLVKMSDLKEALGSAGFDDVRTYIQSGNVFFSSSETDTDVLSTRVRACIKQQFKIDVGVGVFSKAEWQVIISNAPRDWGKDSDWKHNLLVMLKPYDMKQVMSDFGVPKPGMEDIVAGKGVIYQSVSWKMFGRSTSGKLAANPLYKQMTIRNYNTATKLLPLFDN